jgi:hypothetical protein
MIARKVRKTPEGLISYMKSKGYTGLFLSGLCGCAILDIMPCGCNIKDLDCEFGYEVEGNDEFDFMVQFKKPTV